MEWMMDQALTQETDVRPIWIDTRLEDALAALSGYEMLLIRLAYAEELDLPEIGQHVGRTEAYVAQRLGGALAKVRRIYLLPPARPRRPGSSQLGALWRR